ncbi:MAG: cytochrome ubiquinol oxidase subunit I [Acidobacteria bacterium]|nr:cytochrome ubiquinol oxidase subunit I [Acidobacteriota bacterium]
MNYPIWQVPAPGLLIALVSILHVFISHFAVGGGLFLVLTERRARQQNDTLLLDYVRRLSRFFLLLTLVFGAVTGVGIWFTIGLVHPQATSSLINTFVWGWAIEWTMFFTEIAAAMVYYYGWDRLPARTHLAVGWIYFIAAWGSLAVINGIMAYMMTPGGWLTERSFWSGFLNETYLPSLVMRTFVCVGLAGIYALLTASWSGDPRLKAKVARYAGLGWVLPMAVVVPLTLIWYLMAATGAGIPAAEILGADGTGLPAMLKALFTADGTTGYPAAQRAALTSIAAAGAVILMTLFLVTLRRQNYGPIFTGLLTGLSLVAVGGGEWMRADLRKPYVIGGFMFVNGVRLPPPPGAIRAPADVQVADPYALDVLRRDGLLAHARWSQVQSAAEAAAHQEPAARAEALFRTGHELFNLACTKCHTTDGYLGIRPLVAGKSTTDLQTILSNLARPVNREGQETGWDDPDLRLATWRGRRMPPFPGNQEERYALAVYLSRLGGDDRAGFEGPEAQGASPAGLDSGRELAAETCLLGHDPEGDWPMAAMVKGRDTATP